MTSQVVRNLVENRISVSSSLPSNTLTSPSNMPQDEVVSCLHVMMFTCSDVCKCLYVMILLFACCKFTVCMLLYDCECMCVRMFNAMCNYVTAC